MLKTLEFVVVWWPLLQKMYLGLGAGQFESGNFGLILHTRVINYKHVARIGRCAKEF